MNAAETEESAQDQPPTPLPVVAKNIPDELKTLPQWVTWKYELRDNKWTKPPHQVDGRDYARSSEPATWGRFEDALKTYKSGRVDGIGIMLAVDTGIVGLDFDHCYDPQKGSFGAWGAGLQKWAIEIIAHFDSYTEVSPSGTGVRIFVKGKLPAGGRKKGNIEIYSTGRYLTVTGHVVRNRISRVIELRQAEIDAFLLEHFPDPKSKPNHSRNGNGAWHPSDEELLEKAFAAKNGDKIKALFRGVVGSYPSQSEADFALCLLLAFWAQDTAQLDRFYRRSSLYRDKWDQKHGAMTYGEMTIEKAFASCAEHYSRNGNGHAENEGDTHQPLIITMDQIKAEKVDWLWDNRIPIGRLTLLDGDPGSGKSFLSLEIASRVSKGEALPFGGKKRSPANVLLMSCEDGYSDTVRPRLDLLGADVSRIAIPNPQRGLSTTMLNASFIEQAVKELGPSLVVIDPIVAFAGRKNTEKANEVRELLSPLMSIAERYALACLVIRHFTKQVDAKAMYRGGGSVDFMAACRCAFIIVESEDEPNMRVLAQVKNSIGSKSPSVSFSIDGTGEFRWGGHVAANADELLASNRTDNRQREKVQLEAAEQFLRETLSSGPMPSNSIKAKAGTAGISNRTLWRAKETLHIKAEKERGSLDGEWWWRLPAATASGAEYPRAGE